MRKAKSNQTDKLVVENNFETCANIVSSIRRGKRHDTCKLAENLRRVFIWQYMHSALLKDVFDNLTDNANYLKEIANRIESANKREQYEVCHIISYLVRDSWLLRESDERNGKPYKLFGEPLTITFGRLACQLYRAAKIHRNFWLAYLAETDSDPKGMDKHLRRCFRDRRCSR